MSFDDLVNNAKVAIAVAASTIGTGLSAALELIPDDVGKLGTVVGMVLSSVLIYTHWRRGNIDYRKTELEIELLKDRARRDRRKDDPSSD